jgi:hypothetical protein
MKPTLVHKLPPHDDDAPHHLWEIVAAQLLIAGVTASWFYIEGEFTLDREWIEFYVIGAFFWLNLAAVFLAPLAAGCLVLVATIQRSWTPLLYALVEMALWLAHVQAVFPWWYRISG